MRASNTTRSTRPNLTIPPNRLLLTAAEGENPAIVSTGTMIIPPPNPIMDPSMPAMNPNNTTHRCSIIANT